MSAMTPAELLCAREYLGLPKQWMAEHLGVDLKTLWRYERGLSEVPKPVAGAVEELLEHTAEVVSAMTMKCEGMQPGSLIRTYPDTADLVGFPPSWHRMVCSRVAERTGLGITWSPVPKPTAA